MVGEDCGVVLEYIVGCGMCWGCIVDFGNLRECVSCFWWIFRIGYSWRYGIYLF